MQATISTVKMSRSVWLVKVTTKSPVCLEASFLGVLVAPYQMLQPVYLTPIPFQAAVLLWESHFREESHPLSRENQFGLLLSVFFLFTAQHSCPSWGRINRSIEGFVFWPTSRSNVLQWWTQNTSLLHLGSEKTMVSCWEWWPQNRAVMSLTSTHTLNALQK